MNLTPYFEIATNGFFPEDVCRFVGDYMDTVVLSFDGPPEIQNRQRPGRNRAGSFALVAENALKLSASTAELFIRATITRNGMNGLAAWFCDHFKPSALIFEPLRQTPTAEAAGLHPPDPWAFARQCHQAYLACRDRGVRFLFASASPDKIRHSFCPVGRDSVILWPDGRASACYQPERDRLLSGLNLSYGRMDHGRLMLDPGALDHVRTLSGPNQVCSHCLARWHCAGGCRLMPSYSASHREDCDFCIMTRAILVARLLEDLGQGPLAARLLDDRPALEKTVFHPSDRLPVGQEDR